MKEQENQAHQETCDHRSDNRIDGLFVQIFPDFGLQAFCF
jgi:hypothetical protein